MYVRYYALHRLRFHDNNNGNLALPSRYVNSVDESLNKWNSMESLCSYVLPVNYALECDRMEHRSIILI